MFPVTDKTVQLSTGGKGFSFRPNTLEHIFARSNNILYNLQFCLLLFQNIKRIKKKNALDVALILAVTYNSFLK